MEDDNIHLSNSFLFDVWTFSILGSMLVGLSGIFPLLVIPLESGPALKHGEPAKKLKLMLSFAVGSLLGDVFLHLLPEVYAHVDRDNHGSHTRIGLLVIGGLLGFMCIEKLLGDEHEFDSLDAICQENDEFCEIPKTKAGFLMSTSDDNENQLGDEEINTLQLRDGRSEEMTAIDNKLLKRKHSKHNQTKSKEQSCNSEINSVQNIASRNIEKIKVSGYLNLLANVVDNFTHGLAVAASFCISIKVGLVTTMAILLHEIPHEVSDFAILLRSGFDRWKAAKAQLMTATGGVLGAIAALTADSVQTAGERTAWVLPFTSGGFLYIALVTVVPDLLQERQGWESIKQVLCIFLGIASMLGVTVIFD